MKLAKNIFPCHWQKCMTLVTHLAGTPVKKQDALLLSLNGITPATGNYAFMYSLIRHIR